MNKSTIACNKASYKLEVKLDKLQDMGLDVVYDEDNDTLKTHLSTIGNEDYDNLIDHIPTNMEMEDQDELHDAIYIAYNRIVLKRLFARAMVVVRK